MSGARNIVRGVLALVTLCLLLVAGRAEACLVCIPFPEDTATDKIMRADVVVLARENPDKPYSFIAVEVLQGELDRPEIDLFVNSGTRRRLAHNPGDSVLLTLDVPSNHWQSAGYVNSALRALLDEILVRAAGWSQPGQGESRATFFVPYLAAADPAVRELAYLEVGRASYDTIRLADPVVPAGQIYDVIADPLYVEWRALYILLLGIDAAPDEAERIRATMQRKAQFDLTLNLSAWATALVETDGEEGVDWLESVYLADPERDPDAVLEIVKALSVHGARKRSALRERIAESYGVLIRKHPSLAGWAARDLTAWKDWRFADALDELRKRQSEMDGASAYAIDYYVGLARSGRSHSSSIFDVQ